MSDNKVIKVLLAEDETFTRAIVTESLTNAGLQVKSVVSVMEALTVIESFDPHVVLTDLDPVSYTHLTLPTIYSV